MAEAFLQILIENLSSLIEGEIGLILGVDKEMKKLSNTLTTIQKVLEDAEDKQFQSKAIQNWLSKLNDLAFEIEDILDECATEVSKLKHKGGKFTLKKILYNYKIGRRMKEVAEKLDAVAADRHNFHLREIVVPQSRQLVDARRETGSVINEPDHIHGRDEDKEKIVDMLVNQVTNCEQLSILPIVGVGGLGKTTLAQLVYNDQRVRQHFDTKLWICVSDNFDLKILVEAMIESATGNAPNLKHLDALQCRLREVLNDKKYLLILDDVWNDNQEDWVKLKSILACGSKGSSIVVTTRLQKVADVMRTLPAHCLKELSEEHCWLLFRLRAFGQENEQHPNLETIGRQIVKKCAGVPLAAKTLGGLLRFKREEKEWIHVKDSEIWNHPEEEEETSILPVLKLSYRHLPFVLKRCFVYCTVFPKDYIFKKEELIFHWMAHGCISSNGTHEVEDVGDQIWNELVLRSFFQEVTIRRTRTTFKMHDLVHDLAQSIMEKNIPGAQTKSSSTCASNSKIRELRFNEHSETSSSSIAVKVSTLPPIMNYSRLRILKLDGAKMEELPSAIGKLKHLRYLDLSYSSIHTLPRTFCGLWNLKILILDGCYRLKSLPKHIRCMANLRHIFLEGCSSLSDMPSRIGELASLKTLSLFIVGDKIGNQLDELEHLNLGGKLEIKHLERVQNHVNAKTANLVEKPNLRDLILRWEGESISSELPIIKDDEKVLEALEPHLDLETLQIHRFKGSQFPPWMTKMENVTEITISGCPNCSHLPPLGDLPRLQYLCLERLAALEYINKEDEIRGQNSVRAKFPSLKCLRLVCLPKLKRLIKEEVGEMFPNLRSLTITRCELLILPPLSTLQWLSAWKCILLSLSSFSYNNLENDPSLSLGFSKINTTTCNIPEDALESLCNLKKLRIQNAGQHRFPEKWFRGLKSLTELDLVSCKIGSCFPKGWLRHLTALKQVDIFRCEELVELAEEIKYLHLLKRLALRYVDEMVSLPQGLQHIPSLQSLELQGLTQLTSLPDWLGNLTSLTQLYITECPEVPSLPSTIQGMTNLRSLIIYSCPQLERRYEKEKGDDWHKIAHIPELYIPSIRDS